MTYFSNGIMTKSIDHIQWFPNNSRCVPPQVTYLDYYMDNGETALDRNSEK
jgi:hypothetical protein